MSDEYINENETLEGSETSENNDLSEPEIQQDLSSDVPQEDEVRKFQSMYDKAQAELNKVKPVAKLFQDNPELVDVVRNHLTGGRGQIRKSTRLNSSHTVISYAVFCLKKKRKNKKETKKKQKQIKKAK